jgi:hypothetical protein
VGIGYSVKVCAVATRQPPDTAKRMANASTGLCDAVCKGSVKSLPIISPRDAAFACRQRSESFNHIISRGVALG